VFGMVRSQGRIPWSTICLFRGKKGGNSTLKKGGRGTLCFRLGQKIRGWGSLCIFKKTRRKGEKKGSDFLRRSLGGGGGGASLRGGADLGFRETNLKLSSSLGRSRFGCGTPFRRFSWESEGVQISHR